jgi:photosystem II stability/assembly factor-like uncharacterized protein
MKIFSVVSIFFCRGRQSFSHNAARIVLILFCFFSLHNLYAQFGWVTQDNLPDAYGLRKVSFIGQDTGWVWGYGSVLKTTDRGASWNALQSELPCTADDPGPSHTMCWLSTRVGWTVCNKGTIFKTADGGLTWNKVNNGYGGVNNYCEKIFFINNTVGWTLGSEGIAGTGDTRYVIRKTTDGGLTWSQQNTPPMEATIDIFFINANEGYACGGGGFRLDRPFTGSLFSTIDGGITWSLVYETSAALRKIEVVDPLHVWVAGNSGIIINSMDGGSTWTKQNTNTSIWLEDVDFFDSMNGLATGRDSLILSTNDGGLTWSRQPNKTGGSVFMTSSSEAWTVNGFDDRLYHTLDAGKTWEVPPLGSRSLMKDIQFTTPAAGWCVGSSGKILHTGDGGKSWQAQNSKIESTLYTLSFVNDSTGWVAGARGIILRTRDRGATWEPLNSNTNETITSIHFVDNLGWYCGLGGSIKFTSDGGNSWTSQSYGTILAHSNIFFVDQDHGWAVGDYRGVLHTNDGGMSWEMQTAGIDGSARNFRSIYFIDENNGLAVGTGGIPYSGMHGPGELVAGIAYRTDNGGATWHSVIGVNDGVAPLRDVFMDNQNQAWIVGTLSDRTRESVYMAMILHSVDGGESWAFQLAPIYYGEKVYFMDSIGWILGTDFNQNRGILLKTIDFGGEGVPLGSPTKPASPTGLAYKMESDSTIRLSWNDNSENELYFELDRMAPDMFFERIGAPRDTTFLDLAVPGVQYSYRVRAVNFWGASDYAYPDGITGTSKSPELVTLIYPNPTAGRLKVRFGPIAGKEISVRILNSTGVIIKSFTYSPFLEEATLDLPDLANGLYIIQVQSDKEVLTQKFIKH